SAQRRSSPEARLVEREHDAPKEGAIHGDRASQREPLRQARNSEDAKNARCPYEGVMRRRIARSGLRPCGIHTASTRARARRPRCVYDATEGLDGRDGFAPNTASDAPRRMTTQPMISFPVGDAPSSAAPISTPPSVSPGETSATVEGESVRAAV